MADYTPPEHLQTRDADEGAPLWMVSFADMSLLLLCFFIFIVAVSHQGPQLTQELLRRLMLANLEESQVNQAIPQVMSNQVGRVRPQIRWKALAIDGTNRMVPDLNIRFRAPLGRPILFENGSHEIVSDEWQTELEEIAEIVRHHFREIVIQGHCSPKEAAEYDAETEGSNLSYLRALAVKRKLEELGVDASRLRLVSCASYDCADEKDEKLQRRAVVTLGHYFLPGAQSVSRQNRSPGA